jgi:hypothetical protein
VAKKAKSRALFSGKIYSPSSLAQNVIWPQAIWKQLV